MNIQQIFGTLNHRPVKVRRALFSVSDKTGIVELARRLSRLGVEIISTGGTYKTLRDAGLNVTPVSDVTKSPEILNGRVKTLHPAIHAGLLARTDDPEHAKELRDQSIHPIELLVVNLYPFEKTIAGNNVSLSEAIEEIDIGGPAMVRAAAKNFGSVAVVMEPAEYDRIAGEIESNDGQLSAETRFALAKKAFHNIARYDEAISAYVNSLGANEKLPTCISINAAKSHELRYGENPHQSAAFYGDFTSIFRQLHGKELSFNNILDLQSAFLLSLEFEKPAAVIVKHNNPCGVGTDEHLAEAYRKALATDSKSAFGGIVALNREVDAETATAMDPLFLEVVVAPGYAPDAVEIVTRKKDRRIVEVANDVRAQKGLDIRSVIGGYLVQERDSADISPDLMRVVTERKPESAELEAMLFAWRVAKHVRSNAIVYARGDRTLGIGAGQMSRVDSSRVAALKAADARLDLKGCAVASDAFFPFADGLLEAVQAGATAVIQPGGSIRDEEVIQAANHNNIAMIFTGVRHFRH
ncbi:MAG: bifunctional phosphoribosylaminoimidazolecarboxamide formyltransferase/IMP cyclohydrolase [Ignavibacteria bacterium]|nr:bifunctional phosphoribosylaminoimidazolecarboxamide formyltransferase/IMP cyclohydrolase [Ignavibacteria bacterium]